MLWPSASQSQSDLNISTRSFSVTFFFLGKEIQQAQACILGSLCRTHVAFKPDVVPKASAVEMYPILSSQVSSPYTVATVHVDDALTEGARRTTLRLSGPPTAKHRSEVANIDAKDSALGKDCKGFDFGAGFDGFDDEAALLLEEAASISSYAPPSPKVQSSGKVENFDCCST